ncbi:MAG: CPBP family intramembrane glutamic endopeptidase [Candidatus Korobacteraceae bacterium]
MNASENPPAVLPNVAPARNLIAPAWHTVLLVAVLLIFSLASADSKSEFTDEHGRMPIYVMTLAWEWLLTLYVAWSLRSSGKRLRDILGDRWAHPMDAVMDVTIAAGFWMVSALVLAGMAYVLGLAEPENIQNARKQVSFLFPQTTAEVITWILLSATAGFCEEVIFRGYLQTQLARMGGAAWIGIVGQALVFGGAHAYEGWQRMIIIGVWGSMFGGLALLRRNLRPGMMAHTFHDLLVGLVGRVLLR